jgi:hypothetical protein
MVSALPAAEVVRSYFDESFGPRLPAVCLRWGPEGPAERLWELPEGMCFVGPPPQRFGLSVRRLDADAYAVRLLWDRTCLSWSSLSRVQLLTSSLAPLMSALGTDLWSLLDQPVPSSRPGRPRAA